MDDRIRLICEDYDRKLETLRRKNDAAQKEIDRLIYEHIDHASVLRERIAQLEKAGHAMRTALEWYAAPQTWNQWLPEVAANKARNALFDAGQVQKGKGG